MSGYYEDSLDELIDTVLWARYMTQHLAGSALHRPQIPAGIPVTDGSLYYYQGTP